MQEVEEAVGELLEYGDRSVVRGDDPVLADDAFDRV
jgi:hypothetical protein